MASYLQFWVFTFAVPAVIVLAILYVILELENVILGIIVSYRHSCLPCTVHSIMSGKKIV